MMVQLRLAMPSLPKCPRRIDWNQNVDFFRFTRGRFVCREADQMAQRHVSFNMNELCQAASKAVGKSCINVEKCADGMVNKAFILTMDDNEQVVAKVPNPNAGLPHLTTASEVATMDFARNVLKMPAPRVLAWSSSDRTKVEAEYIIMEKARGVQLQEIWTDLSLSQRVQIAKSVARYQRAWTKASFNRIGSLYYAADLPPAQNVTPCYRVEDSDNIDARFVIGPIQGREWMDLGRARLKCDRGPWPTAALYRRATVQRDLQAARTIDPLPKPLDLLCGPGLYQPTPAKKERAGSAVLKFLPQIMPSEEWASTFHLWHDDLHAENIFVDPNNPTEILSVIDWQSTFISPLFDHTMVPGFLDVESPPPRGMEQPSPPDLPENATQEEIALADELYHEQSLLYGFKILLRNNIMSVFEATQYIESDDSNLLYTSRRLFEIGEAHTMAAVIALEPPGTFSEAEITEIDRDLQKTNASIHVMNAIKKSLGDLFPDKGVISHEHYEDTKMALRNAKEQIINDFSASPEDRLAWESAWPFDD